jgi:RHS repeat-associated protein
LYVNAGSDQTGTACGVTSVSLSASPSTGTWSVISGSGGSFTNSSSPTSDFSGSFGVSYTLRWNAGSGNCTGSDDVVVAFNQYPTTPNAGSDQTICGSSVSLSGNTPSIGNGAWSFAIDSPSSGGSIHPAGSANATLSGSPGGVYGVVWTTTNGPCHLSDEAYITFIQNPTTANAGADQSGSSTCGLTTVTLAANSPSVGTGSWSVVSGSGGSFGNSSSPTSTFSGNAGSSYTLRWTISNSPCTSSTDDAVITFNRNPTAANAGSDQSGASTCGLTTVTLAANAPSVGTGSWSVVSGSGGSFGNAASPTSTFTGTPEVNYTLRWTLSNSPCTASTDDVQIKLHPLPDVNVSAGSQTICSGQTATINITNPNNLAGTTFGWTTSVVNTEIPDVTSPATSISGIFSNADGVNDGTVTYTIYPNLGLCTGTPVTATVVIRNTPDQPVPMSPLYYGTSPAQFRAFAPEGTTTQWYSTAVSTPAFATGDTYTNTSTTDPLTYYISFKNQGNACESTRVPISATTVGVISPASIVQEIVRVPGKTTDANVNGLNNTSEKSVAVSYADGLSRVVQSIAINASPSQNDVVVPSEFDSYGRPSKQYLPYTGNLTSTTADPVTGNVIPDYQSTYKADQLAFYNASGDKIDNDNSPFVQSGYETSPLGRILEQGKAGAAWQPGTGKTVRMAYSFNNGAGGDDVRIFISPFTVGSAVTTQSYADNTLDRTTITDENSNHEIVFMDMAGHTVMRKKHLDGTINSQSVDYLRTAYVYNEKGQLTYIIPPGGYAKLQVNGWVLTQAILDDHLYQFVYDNRGRLTQRKTPGQAWGYMAYDKLNRPVLSQDGNLRALNKWAFVKYDLKGRPVMSGLYTNTSQTTLAGIQGILDGQYTVSNPYYETRGTALYGYSNQSFPTLNADNSPLEIFVVNYYDSYDFDNNGTPDYTYDNTHLSGLPSSARSTTIGFPTGGRKRVLRSADWIVSAVFYDVLGRPIQTQTNNHLNFSANDKSSVTYDFEGKVVQSKADHNSITITQTPQYNAGGITTGLRNKINSGTDQLVVQYQYNELGQVVMKQLHDTGGSNFLQNVDYRYNINGWLTSINNAQLNSDGGATNSDANDYFGMELIYNTVDAGLGNNGLFNGNVSAMKWKGSGADAGTTGQQSYKFTYDKADKLLDASFQKYGTSSWNQEQNTLNEAMTYDHNGNILTLQRKQNQRGLSGITVTSTAQLVDDLTYTYVNGNKLDKVVDAGNASGFKDAGGSATDYSYDTQSNVISDQNKGISAITYNVLGKAQQITFTDGHKIKYTYDASGTKVKMTSYATSTDSTVTDYVNGFVYTNGTVGFFGSPEGRVIKNGSNYEYQYSIADHQGNTRVVFSSVTPTPDAPVATFEGDSNDKSSLYLNVSNIVPFTAANHTPSGNKVVRMNQTYSVGPAQSFKVYPGDAVDMEVYAYYEAATGYGTSNAALSTLVTYIAGAFGGVSGAAGESGAIYNGVNNGLTGFGVGANQGDERPAAYLNYLQFDQNYNLLDAGWTPVPPSANFSKQKVSIPTKTVKEAGFMFVYLSYENESNNWVYFDDFKVTHTKTSVIQYNEYYPFGLQNGNSWTREDNSNNFLYNEGSEINTTSGFYDLPFRNYDAALGRFFQVDPLATSDHSMSPFAYAGNSPIVGNDPSGLMVDYTRSRENADYQFQLLVNAQNAEQAAANAHLWSQDRGEPHGGGNWGGAGVSAAQFMSWGLENIANGGFGGSWNNGAVHVFGSNEEAFFTAAFQITASNGWSSTAYGSFEGSLTAFVQQTQGNEPGDPPFPPSSDLILRFNSSVTDLFLSRMASVFSGSVDPRVLEAYVQYYGNSPFKDDVGAVPTIRTPDGFVHPWSFSQSIYLVGYSIMGINEDGSTAFDISNPFFNEARRENLEYEIEGYGAPYWSTSFMSGSMTIKVYATYNTRDPNN